MTDLIQKATQQSPLRIAFWLSTVLFCVLFAIQEGAFAAVGFGVLVLFLAIGYWRAKRVSAQRPQSKEPPWLRPVLFALLAVLGLALVGGLFEDREPLGRAIDAVLLLQLVLAGLLVAKGRKSDAPPAPRGSSTEEH
jgi:hypothetical protein